MLFQKLLLLLPAAVCAAAAAAAAPPALAPAPTLTPLNTTAVNVTAIPPQEGDPKDFGPCSDWYEFYGIGRWTYTEMQWCFRQTATHTQLIQEQRNPWYYWGLAWYQGKTYKLSWNTKGTVEIFREFSSGNKWNDGPTITNIYDFGPRISPGTYEVRVNYYQEGPWWSADAAINEYVNFVVSIPP